MQRHFCATPGELIQRMELDQVHDRVAALARCAASRGAADSGDAGGTPVRDAGGETPLPSSANHAPMEWY